MAELTKPKTIFRALRKLIDRSDISENKLAQIEQAYSFLHHELIQKQKTHPKKSVYILKLDDAVEVGTLTSYKHMENAFVTEPIYGAQKVVNSILTHFGRYRDDNHLKVQFDDVVSYAQKHLNLKKPKQHKKISNWDVNETLIGKLEQTYYKYDELRCKLNCEDRTITLSTNSNLSKQIRSCSLGDKLSIRCVQTYSPKNKRTAKFDVAVYKKITTVKAEETTQPTARPSRYADNPTSIPSASASDSST